MVSLDSKGRSFMRGAATALALLIMVISALYTAGRAAGLVRQRQLEQKVSVMYIPPNAPEVVSPSAEIIEAGTAAGIEQSEAIEPPRLALSERRRFSMLLGANRDFLGMLSIPGLGIELPFVQCGDNAHYLSYGFDGGKSRYGTVFLDYRNAPELSDKNNVLYGHNMKDGSMFHNLSEYKNLPAAQAAPVIYIDSIYGRTEWLVFAAYVCEADCGYNDATISGEDFEALLASIRRRSMLDNNVDVNAEDMLLTLSTCDYSFDNARFAVHARKKRCEELVPPGMPSCPE